MEEKITYAPPGAAARKQTAPDPHIEDLTKRTQENLVTPARNETEAAAKNGYVKSASIPDLEEFATSLKAEGYERFTYLSGGVFYNNTPLFVRRMRGVEIKKMAAAAEADSVTLLLDVMADTVHPGGLDVRDLTPGDFKYLMYWHRLRSYTKRPWVRRWTSQYGNNNEVVTTDIGKVLIKPHAMTEKDYAVYTEKGLCVPTMRVLEFIENTSTTDVTAADRMSASVALFFKGNTWAEKLEAFDNADIELIELARQLEQEYEHGVIELLTLKDEKFDPKIWAESLIARADNLEALIPEYISLGFDNAAFDLRMEARTMRNEATLIKKRLEEGKEVLAEPEVISVPMTAATFLSGL